jgi:outer membrane protein TolC
MAMSRWLVLATVLALALPHPVSAQGAPRRLSFAELAAAVAQSNLSLRAAAFEVAIAQAQLAQARGARLPQVTATGSYTTGQQVPGTTVTFGSTTITVPAPSPDQILLRLGVEYQLYTGGRLESQIALAEANVRGAQAVFARAAQQVVFSAQQAYLQALLARDNLMVAQRATEEAAEGLRIAQARVRTGAAAEFDSLQAEVALTNAQQGVVRTQVGVRNADASLNSLLNQPLNAPLELTDTLEPRPVSGTLQSATAAALRSRPEIAEFGARMDALKASIALAASGGQPTLSLGAGYAVAGAPNATYGAWAATLSVTLAVFDGGITRARIREAELKLEQLGVQEADTRQRIALDVSQAWLALEQAAGELVASAKAVEQAREAARIAGVRYQAGLSTQLEVLSAQSTQAQAEFGLASARFSQNLARVQLLLATGGGL